MDVKQEEMFQVKQEELIIKDEYISNPDSDLGSTSVLTFSALATEDCVKTHFTHKQSQFEDYSYQSETKSTIINTKINCSDFNSSYRGSLKRQKSKCKINLQQEYACAHCSYSTKRKRDLKSHLKKHMLTKLFACKQCDLKTSRKDHLIQHILTHSGEKPHHCNQCDFKTLHKCSLKKHMFTHSGEKPHHCKQCDFKTSQIGNFKRHTLIHNVDKPHHCEQCDFKTSQRGNLKRHMLIHCGDKPVQCEQCDFKTSRKGHLQRHMLTHSVEKPLHCKQCDFKTSQEHNLKKHMLLTHCSENSNHSGVTDSLLKKICHTDGFNEDTKDSKKFILDLEIVPEECVVFNSMDFFIKEEPNDSDL